VKLISTIEDYAMETTFLQIGRTPFEDIPRYTDYVGTRDERPLFKGFFIYFKGHNLGLILTKGRDSSNILQYI